MESMDLTAAEKAAKRLAATKTDPNGYINLGDILEDEDTDMEESISRRSYVKQHSIIKHDESGKFGVLYDERGTMH